MSSADSVRLNASRWVSVGGPQLPINALIGKLTADVPADPAGRNEEQQARR
jgi:hypothetical protein